MIGQVHFHTAPSQVYFTLSFKPAVMLSFLFSKGPRSDESIEIWDAKLNCLLTQNWLIRKSAWPQYFFPHIVMFRVETWVCFEALFFSRYILVDYCTVRETGKGKGEAERDREEVDRVEEIERGPYWVTQTMVCVFSVEQRRCSVNEACCSMAASALSLHCVCVCVKGKWQRPLWVLSGLCSPSVPSWLEYVRRSANLCPQRPISKDNRRISATQMLTWINTNASTWVVKTYLSRKELKPCGDLVSLHNSLKRAVCSVCVSDPHKGKGLPLCWDCTITNVYAIYVYSS